MLFDDERDGNMNAKYSGKCLTCSPSFSKSVANRVKHSSANPNYKILKPEYDYLYLCKIFYIPAEAATERTLSD